VLISAVCLIYQEWQQMPAMQNVVQLVNQQFKPSEYSTDLLLEDNLDGLRALQRAKVITALEQQIPAFKYPVKWRNWFFFALLLSVVTSAGLLLINNFEGKSKNVILVVSDTTSIVQFTESDTVFLKEWGVTIQPPAYTRKSVSSTTKLNIQFPEGSQLTWQLQFVGKPLQVWISTNSGDSLVHRQGAGLKLKPIESGFYTLHYQLEDSTIISSPFYELRMITDEPPVVAVVDFPQFQKLDYAPQITFDLPITFSDDYGLTDGYIVATITKGSGESVKFREQKINFSQPIGGTSATRNWSVNLDKLDMEPGNELYFYATAFDNKPIPQQTRTETFFIILADTAEVEFSLQGALGVDLMPDFFRSQLQIIIDTEQLLRNKSKIPAKEFNSKSNELGYDQKQLRLKYGQFIGEEDDSGLDIGGGDHYDHGDEGGGTGENVLEEYGHDTDHENEEGGWMDKGTEPDKNPLAEYTHAHDDTETATFYTQTLKDKLRAALNEMWQAELYLRLFTPKESLPYQYKAQELLKEIRNHARIYVQRIGFEPPPVNVAEARFTGKLKEVNKKAFEKEISTEEDLPAIRKAIAVLDKVIVSKNWNDENRLVVQSAGDELAGLAIAQPGRYLKSLNLMRTILDQPALGSDDISKITILKKALSEALKRNAAQPVPIQRSNDELSRHFIKALSQPNP
jgi:hypothetical protein